MSERERENVTGEKGNRRSFDIWWVFGGRGCADGGRESYPGADSALIAAEKKKRQSERQREASHGGKGADAGEKGKGWLTVG